MKKTLTYSMLCLIVFTFIAGTIDLNNLDNYANQTIPSYITKDNTTNNVITDEGATLGRVLFYDKNLSTNNTIACASCHQQEFAFGDTSFVSQGVNGLTGRHSMRLINARFAEEDHFFWDKRANTLEEQTTMPIQDHAEMGYSGTNGEPTFADLLNKLDALPYYNDLFYAAFGDTIITEARMQNALAQFIRSIQSFDSKYDVGRAQVSNDMMSFPNFTANENAGKTLFLAPTQFDSNSVRISGGANCNACHRAPEFDIDPNSLNNGIFGAVNGGLDLNINRAPTLRDLANPDNVLNGNLMHNGVISTLGGAVIHYDNIVNLPQNPTLNQTVDPRLRPMGNAQVLNFTPTERLQLVAFLRTLTGSDVYTNPKWSDPFDANGNITVLGGITPTREQFTTLEVDIFPNPATAYLNISGINNTFEVTIINMNGSILQTTILTGNPQVINIEHLSKGVTLLKFKIKRV